MLSPSKPPFEQRIVSARPALRRFALRLCKDADKADDLVQDTMLRALTNREMFDPETNIDAWLFTILRNSFLSGRRRGKREVEDPDEQMAKRIPFEDSPLKRLEISEMLRLMDKMPENFRRPLRLIADGASYEEAALELTEQVGTIKSRINRAREILKAAD